MKYALLFTVLFALAKTSYGQAFYSLDPSQHEIRKMEITTIFPNPAFNQAHILLNQVPFKRVSVDIIDFNSVVRRTYHFPPESRILSFDISFLERGYYVFRLRNENSLLDLARFVKS